MGLFRILVLLFCVPLASVPTVIGFWRRVIVRVIGSQSSGRFLFGFWCFSSFPFPWFCFRVPPFARYRFPFLVFFCFFLACRYRNSFVLGFLVLKFLNRFIGTDVLIIVYVEFLPSGYAT